MDGFILKKVLSNVVHLVPAAFLLLLVALTFMRWSPRLSRIVLFVVTCSLLALSSAPVSNAIVATLEDTYSVVQELPDDTALILVLGSGHHYLPERPANSVLMPVALARLSEGVRLWKTRPDVHMMLSGTKFRSEISHAQAMANMAHTLDVSTSQIVLADETRDTAEEIFTAREWMISNAGANKRLIVVSSAMHLSRAALMLNDEPFEYTMAPTDFRTLDAPWYRFSSQHLMDVDAALHEYVGMLWHRFSQ